MGGGGERPGTSCCCSGRGFDVSLLGPAKVGNGAKKLILLLKNGSWWLCSACGYTGD